ncbi:hypothetical protein [Natronolimnohabitans innermongolicus]|uniref:CHAT domain-containing protein n=1 Tax=Natronolimnohabitans innermongolicus JCM 12255 TaxID=1227499 RepID=L9XN98_9EURY|nr:hypothetical protein [Natronolimnohabitans innermongolicus]ELY62123.1 hypothetical protein C493_00870 [Natronolimnohabitans innermongolicus JCM 12255]
MIEWAVEDGTLRVTDADSTELSVRGGTLAVDGAGPDIPRPVDETVAVTTDELRFPHAVAYAFSLGAGEQHELDPDGSPLSLSPGEYVVDVDAEIKTYLRFSGRATIEKTDGYEETVVTFPNRVRVILGFRSHHELPTGTITVPDDPESIATAITHLSASHKTDGPDRTYPTLRGHPALLESGDELSIPDEIRTEHAPAGIELIVPADYESLFVTAPLAYYLQATVTTRKSTASGPDYVTLRLPEHGIERRLSAMPDLERDVERLLRKVFFFDCLVRNAGPYSTELAERRLLEVLDLDAEDLYEASPQRRLATYLEISDAAIEHRLPDWHLATYVSPDYGSVDALPFLLDRMSLLYMPRTSELEGKELVERSLEDFYRGGSRSNAGRVASVDIVKPELRNGRVHGWLADGVPIDVFKTTREAYRNRLDFLERSRDATSICVVLNDPDMAGEHDDVATIYRQRSEELSMDVTVEESLTTAELARVFEREYDFVHYIGHCETDGLRCPDGNLSTSTLERCNAQTFFLNACGSYYEGMGLIENGSVAGAVTFSKVLNDHAVKVGSTFAKLLVHGFSIERALDLARRRIMMGKDYAVVGDGTHSLTQGEHRVPITITLEELEDEPTGAEYLATFDCYSTRVTGSYYFPHVEANDVAYLCGSQSNFTVTESELVTVLEETEASVIYDGDVYWSTTLASQFDG